ncbi:hypothetical protein ACFQMA_21005 [Halosimplex aquaticum]|uniref:SPW repeat-containing protein n=1 Tax=Halosimplex aquaticum TaxID=3026162 RepID=A0ABD5Y4N6_9EURY|nr:hypothetical protein [Halosimplex aquaticum]
MVSRDTAVHVTVVALAFAGMAVLSPFVFDAESPVAFAALAAFNGVVLAGAHLYLAWRGEDGLVPVSSRWRFVGAVGVIVALGAASAVTDPVAVGPVTTDGLLAAIGGVVAIGYLFLEARSGYRESADETGA